MDHSVNEGVEEVKYTTSLIVMLMINKYFMSIPLYRQENLQSYLGVPLPASTQWELMAKHENVLKALYHAFEYDGAQARGVSIDDTKARILEQIAKNKKAEKRSDKASCFTTGIVCAHDDHMSYIFVTDNQTAGKSVAPFLNYILKRWTQLTQFLRHAYIPLDTNLTERALKLIIQIRKSCMFYKSPCHHRLIALPQCLFGCEMQIGRLKRGFH